MGINYNWGYMFVFLAVIICILSIISQYMGATVGVIILKAMCISDPLSVAVVVAIAIISLLVKNREELRKLLSYSSYSSLPSCHLWRLRYISL